MGPLALAEIRGRLIAVVDCQLVVFDCLFQISSAQPGETDKRPHRTQSRRPLAARRGGDLEETEGLAEWAPWL